MEPAASAHPLLELRRVSKLFPGVKALDEVDLSLHRGEVLVLVGENGAGKSTLMKIIAGVYQPDEGQMLWEGREVRFASPADSQRQGVRIVYQEQALIPDLNAIQNIFIAAEQTHLFGSSVLGVLNDRKMRADAGDLIRRTFELEIDLDRPVKELPLVQRQIVEIIRVIVNRAQLLILDEPTATLEASEKHHLFAFINTVKRSGVGVIYCSHYIEECLELGDRILALRDGRKAGEDRRENTSVTKIIEMMIGKSIADQFPKYPARIAAEPVLRVRGLSRKREYEDISFDLHPGEILGVAGLAGSGKRSLARSLFGVEKWHAGTVQVGAQVFTRPFSIGSAMHHGLAFLPSDRKTEGLILDESVRYNIILAHLRAVTRGWIRRRLENAAAARFIEALRIKTPSGQTAVSSLSGGNQQKVVLARWLFRQPRVLLFDEPTRGIDVNAKVEVYRLMGEFVQGGGAIVMVSSEVPELEAICDRVLVMHNGRISVELEAEGKTEQNIMYHSVVAAGGRNHG